MLTLGEENMEKRRKTLILIDGSGFVFRAYYALPRLTTRKGLPTHAVYGFIQMIRKLLDEFDYDYIAVAFDAKGPTYRHKIFEDYKISRPPKPPELDMQWPWIQKVCEALGIPIIEIQGFEADDIIASLARKASKENINVIIVTSDKDMFQLLDGHIKIFRPMKEKLYDRKTFENEYGFQPDLMKDYLALVGDKIDDIPGVKGIGDKTARNLIQKYGNLQSIYKHLDELKPAIRKKLEAHRKEADLSLQLVELSNIPELDIPLENLKRKNPNISELRSLFQELEFYSLLKEYTVDITEVESDYRTVTSLDELSLIDKQLGLKTQFAFALLYEGSTPLRGELIGLALSYEQQKGWYIPLTQGNHLLKAGFSLDAVRPFLQKWFESERFTRIGFNIKSDIHVLRRYGLHIQEPFHDVQLMAYALDPGRPLESIERLAQEILLYRMIALKDLPGKGKSWEDIPLEVQQDFACERADIILQLYECTSAELKKQELSPLWKIYNTIDLPLIPILVHMEAWGIKIDRQGLKKLARDISTRIHRIQNEIFEKVGFVFNLNSSKQLAKVLFETLGLQPIGKTRKTRQYSTRMEVLEELSQHHEVPRLIITYRNLAKSKSTYIDPLLEHADPKTDRVHTTFHIAATATGRLSSSDPNLQNIPIRDEPGDEIRKCFIAEKGWVLISADYSQIELRILAHFSEDERLIRAFQHGEDIHTLTASEVLGIPKENVTANHRRMAKAVNYGIAYGLSAYGLSQQTGMDVHSAQEFIDRYFARYTGVREWIQKLLEKARKTGYVETLFGRRRYIPDLTSPDTQIRQAGERQAINMPIQGTSADLMKKAMMSVFTYLKENGLKTRLLLQIHDELLLESPEHEVYKVVPDIRRIMEDVIELKVPLVVDIHTGSSWYETKHN